MTPTHRPAPIDRSPSGEHPAVKGYRKKLASIAEQIPDNDDLDADLANYLAELKTPRPPPPDEPAPPSKP